jgi:hypothetical protein
LGLEGAIPKVPEWPDANISCAVRLEPERVERRIVACVQEIAFVTGIGKTEVFVTY